MSAPPAAGVARRLGALAYDTLLLGALLFAAAAAFLGVVVAATGVQDAIRPGEALHHPLQLYLLAVACGYFAVFWRRGGTPGMRTWNLTIVTTGGGVPSVRDCLVRLLAAAVSLGAAGLGYLWMAFNRERLTWHDLASSTRIVASR